MRPELCLPILLVTAMPAAADPLFVPRPIEPHRYEGGWEHFVGGGVAAFDCSGDSLPELFAAGGENPAQLFLNRSAPGGDLVFDAVEGTLSLTGVTGAYPLDIDSDGIMDLAILRVGENTLMRGLGECRFSPFSGIGFQTDARWTTAFSATWEAEQTLPTLAFGNYVDRTDPDGPFEACDINQLYRPEGDSYAPPLPLEPGFCALSMLFSDWGRQGRADLRVSNDRHYYVRGGEEQMWAMDPVPRLYGPDDGWNSHQLWGMGIASRDLDGDGRAEVYLTSMGDQRLQALAGGSDGPSYLDAPYESGATAHRPYTGGDGRPSTGWHAVFGDVDNDGWDDLFVAKGNVEQMPGSAMEDPNNLLMQQPDGSFAEGAEAAGIATLERSRGAVFEDLNLDGHLDLAVVNRRADMELYENTGTDGNWLLVDLAGPAPNTRAIGAAIEVEAAGRTQTREITIGGGHAGGSAVAQHFGLGDAGSVRLRVIWPDGGTGEWQEVSGNQRITLTR